MREVLGLMVPLLTGVLLGAIFFGGLWATIRRGLSSKQPALWFLGSFLLRTSTAVVGFLVVSRGQWDRLLACLLGFVVARLVVTWLTRQSGASQSCPAREIIHAP
ncbi:MAG TPA: ATP synthase subunit I [Pirellulales bacterium]|jgi:F1F0 ATPase subunit 2|nr:ATP synthase subunit I [Pirellulales bacterium]